MFKKILSLLLCFLMIFLFTACGNSKRKKINVVFPIDSDPGYLDPQVVSTTGAKNIVANCFEGLVTLNSNGEIAPGCAENWTISPDGLTYTFILNKNCDWLPLNASSEFLGENYKENFDTRVTAHDFVFGLRRALLPETKSPGAKNLFSIENAALVNAGKLPVESLGVQAIDDYTLVIRLTQADPDFLYVLLEPQCMPCNQYFFEMTGGKYGLSMRFLMYNGPFYMLNWVDDYSITLMENHEYYDYENLKPYTIYYSINDEQNTRLDKIKEEVYDVAPLSAEQANELGKKRGYEIRTFESGLFCLAFNCNDSVLSNINIRKAIAYSFNSSVFYQTLGQEATAKGIIPSSMLLSGNKYRDAAGSLTINKQGDPQEYLEKGLDELYEDSISITVLCPQEYESAIRHVMQSWQSVLGVKFNIFVEIAEASEIKNIINEEGDWQIALTDLSFPNLTAFNGLLQFTSGNSANVTGFSDKQYDKLVSKIKTTSGLDTSISTTKEAEQYLLDNCALIPLFDYPSYYGLGKTVENIIFNPTGEILYFKYTNVD